MKSISLTKLNLGLVLALLLTWILFQLGAFDAWRGARPMDEIRESGALKVLTRNTSTTYYLDGEQALGPEYDLVRAFARELGVRLEFIVKDTIDDLFRALEQGEGHLVAAGITRTEARTQRFRFGPGYQTVQQQVICRRGADLPTQPADLVGRHIAILADSSYSETLNTWREQFPELAWKESREHSTEQILEAVASGEVECSLADSNIVAVNRRFLPELEIAFAAAEPQNLAWVLPDSAVELERRLRDWFEREETETLIATVLHRYYGHVDLFDYVDNNVFQRRIESRLPGLRGMMEAVAERYRLPWSLIAAQAYQESHWDPTAQSPTGVRGLMMLTRRTAESLGVRDRLDSQQSIDGGARYLVRMLERLPDSIKTADRLWFALAAYNIGMGHLQDARRLASELGRDPDRWYDIEQTLPLLSQQHYFKQLKYGYARGTEPVRYVRNVRNYRDILEHALQNGD